MEGKYYVWSLAEINEVLGADRAKTFAYVYDVTRVGQLGSIRTSSTCPSRSRQAAKLLGRDEAELRAELADGPRQAAGRARPPRAAGQGHEGPHLVERPDDRRRWPRAARILEDAALPRRRRPRRRLHPRPDADAPTAGCCTPTRTARPSLNAYLDDYANLIDGLTRLYEATGEPRWIESALELARVMIDEFADPEHGGFFYTGQQPRGPDRPAEGLLRQRDAVGQRAWRRRPCVRLGALTGRDDLTQAGRSALESVQLVLETGPAGGRPEPDRARLPAGPDRGFAVIAGHDPAEYRAVLEAIASRFLPHKVVAPATYEQAADPREQGPAAGRSPAPRRPHDDLHLRELRLPGAGASGVEALRKAQGLTVA